VNDGGEEETISKKIRKGEIAKSFAAQDYCLLPRYCSNRQNQQDAPLYSTSRDACQDENVFNTSELWRVCLGRQKKTRIICEED
jgi:hypothetical protein